MAEWESTSGDEWESTVPKVPQLSPAQKAQQAADEASRRALKNWIPDPTLSTTPKESAIPQGINYWTGGPALGALGKTLPAEQVFPKQKYIRDAEFAAQKRAAPPQLRKPVTPHLTNYLWGGDAGPALDAPYVPDPKTAPDWTPTDAQAPGGDERVQWTPQQIKKAAVETMRTPVAEATKIPFVPTLADRPKYETEGGDLGPVSFRSLGSLKEQFSGPEHPIAGPITGLLYGLGKFGEGLTTPENAMIMAGMGIAPPIVAGLAEGKFAADMFLGAVATVPRIQEAYNKGDWADLAANLTEMAAQGYFATKTGEGALRVGRDIIDGARVGAAGSGGVRGAARGAAEWPTLMKKERAEQDTLDAWQKQYDAEDAAKTKAEERSKQRIWDEIRQGTTRVGMQTDALRRGEGQPFEGLPFLPKREQLVDERGNPLGEPEPHPADPMMGPNEPQVGPGAPPPAPPDASAPTEPMFGGRREIEALATRRNVVAQDLLERNYDEIADPAERATVDQLVDEGHGGASRMGEPPPEPRPAPTSSMAALDAWNKHAQQGVALGLSPQQIATDWRNGTSYNGNIQPGQKYHSNSGLYFVDKVEGETVFYTKRAPNGIVSHGDMPTADFARMDRVDTAQLQGRRAAQEAKRQAAEEPSPHELAIQQAEVDKAQAQAREAEAKADAAEAKAAEMREGEPGSRAKRRERWLQRKAEREQWEQLNRETQPGAEPPAEAASEPPAPEALQNQAPGAGAPAVTAGDPTVTAGDQTVTAEPHEPTVPESGATIQAQLAQLAEGKRVAVQAPAEHAALAEAAKGGKIDTVRIGDKTYAYDADATSAAEIQHMINANRLGELLGPADGGYGEASKPPNADTAVVGRNNEGTEVGGVVTTKENVPKVAEQMAKVAENVAVEDPAQVLSEREAANAADAEAQALAAETGMSLEEAKAALAAEPETPAPAPAVPAAKAGAAQRAPSQRYAVRRNPGHEYEIIDRATGKTLATMSSRMGADAYIKAQLSGDVRRAAEARVPAAKAGAPEQARKTLLQKHGPKLDQIEAQAKEDLRRLAAQGGGAPSGGGEYATALLNLGAVKFAKGALRLADFTREMAEHVQEKWKRSEWQKFFNAAKERAADIARELSARNPTAVSRTENPLNEVLTNTWESFTRIPHLFQRNIDLMREYPNFRDIADADHNVAAERMIERVKDNLLHLYDRMPEEFRQRAKLWYDGANRIAKRWAQQYDVTPEQVAGVMAVNSPQTEWFTNADRARRIVEAWKNRDSLHWDDRMNATWADVGRSIKGEENRAIFNAIKRKSFNEISDPYLRSVWFRLYDEAVNDKTFPVIMPEGEFGDLSRNADGSPAAFSWADFDAIEKSFSILENGSRENIHERLGKKNKIRNFYNNIINPDSERGHSTIDTHAVGAGLFRTQSSSSLEANHNFGSGIPPVKDEAGNIIEEGRPGSSSSTKTGENGTYGLYAEAYRRAAADRGVLPREMQSITWEAIRSLFSPDFKGNEANVKLVDDVWQDVADGKITPEQARTRVERIAKGYDRPEWYDGNWDIRIPEEDGHPSRPGEVPPVQVHEPGAKAGGRPRRGDRDGLSARAASPEPPPEVVPPEPPASTPPEPSVPAARAGRKRAPLRQRATRGAVDISPQDAAAIRAAARAAGDLPGGAREYLRQKWADTEDARTRFRTRWTDQYAAVERLMRQGKVSMENSPYVAMRLFAGLYGKIDNRLHDLGNVLKEAKAAGLSMDDLGKYAELERHEENHQNQQNRMLSSMRYVDDLQAKIDALKLEQEGKVDEARAAVKDADPRLMRDIDAYARQYGKDAVPQMLRDKLAAAKEQLERDSQLYILPDDAEGNRQTIDDIIRRRQDMEQNMSPEKKAAMDKGLEGIRRISRGLLKESLDAGLISKDDYDAMVATGEKYVPLQKLAKLSEQLEKANYNEGGEDFSVAQQNLYKRIKGGTGETLNPLTGIVRNIYQTMKLIERNGVAKKMGELATDPDFAGLVEPMMETRVNPKTGGTFQAERALPEGMDTFSYLDDGKQVRMMAPTDVVAALKHMDKESADVVSRMARRTSSWARAGSTTYAIPFIMTNLMRDFQTAMVTAAGGGGSFGPATWLRGAAEAIKKGDDYRLFHEYGGSHGGYFEGKRKLDTSVADLTDTYRDKLRKAPVRTIASSIVQSPFELIRKAGEVVELAPRLGTFKKAIREGASGEEAAFRSRNATVDFAKRGEFMKIANMWIPFLNARAQGTLSILRAIKENPAKASAMIAATTMLPSAATAMWNRTHHKEVWDDIDQWEKDNYFILIYGDGKDEQGRYTDVIKIPKGEAGKTFGNLSEALIARGFKDPGYQSLLQTAGEAAESLSPVNMLRRGKFSGSQLASTALHPALKAAVQWPTNYDLFRDQPIVRDAEMQKAHPWKQFDDRTGWVSKQLGTRLGLSPMMLDMVAETMGGSLGRTLSHLGPDQTQAGSKALGNALVPALQLRDRLLRARSGEEGRRLQEDAKEIGAEEADQNVDLKREAKAAVKRVMDLPEAERGAAAQAFIEAKEREIAALPEGPERDEAARRWDKMNDQMDRLVERATLRMSPPEITLHNMSTEGRARTILKQLRALPPDKVDAQLKRWEDIGVLSERVSERLSELASAQ